MNDPEYTGSSLPDELIEAVKERLAEGDAEHIDPAPAHAAEDSLTDPEVYAETDPSENTPDVQPGDAGTYAGDYAPAEDPSDVDVSERDDLPEGYVPGTYAGPYTPAGEDRASN